MRTPTGVHKFRTTSVMVLNSDILVVSNIFCNSTTYEYCKAGFNILSSLNTTLIDCE